MSEAQRAAHRQPIPDDTRRAAGSAAMFEFATRWQEAMVRFCGLRMNRYVELSSRLWECRSPHDLLRLQTDFVQKMLADYKSESDVVCGQLVDAQKSAIEHGAHHAPSYEAAILDAQKDAAKIIDLAKDQASRIVADAMARVAAPPAAAPKGEQRNRSAAG
ncbi:MAG: hypothetical protein M3N38_12660 [Pseudomonadota bacterium]|nr:hypothetical protein [Pseudomonadota bacterium]